jgi:serine/threonine protein phosphatase PrpC
MKIDSCTIAGYSSPGIQKINQDNFFIIKEFLDEQEQFFLGVCDGHGTNGHLVSEYITKTLPDYLQDTSDESIINTFISTNDSLINNSKIDCSLSGSTCTTLIINLEKIICANLGDSRAVLAKYEKGAYNAIDLSRDHKPSDPDEMKRILLKGGRIRPFYDEELKKYLGPERVWLNNSDIPGLAMTRSLGDKVAHSVGVISEPEIRKYEFNGNEKFIILASDGIWEYIDSDECVTIVKDFYENDMDAIGALNSLVKQAFNRWKSMEESIDDITAIIIFFE